MISTGRVVLIERYDATDGGWQPVAAAKVNSKLELLQYLQEIEAPPGRYRAEHTIVDFAPDWVKW